MHCTLKVRSIRRNWCAWAWAPQTRGKCTFTQRNRAQRKRITKRKKWYCKRRKCECLPLPCGGTFFLLASQIIKNRGGLPLCDDDGGGGGGRCDDANTRFGLHRSYALYVQTSYIVLYAVLACKHQVHHHHRLHGLCCVWTHKKRRDAILSPRHIRCSKSIYICIHTNVHM